MDAQLLEYTTYFWSYLELKTKKYSHVLRLASTDSWLARRRAAGQKLQRIIKKFRQNLFVFVTNRDVPPTNNGSEQALRPCVIFRKVTNCFRSEWGARLYADVRSVIETARRRGAPILQSIRLTLDGQPLPAGP